MVTQEKTGRHFKHQPTTDMQKLLGMSLLKTRKKKNVCAAQTPEGKVATTSMMRVSDLKILRMLMTLFKR